MWNTNQQSQAKEPNLKFLLKSGIKPQKKKKKIGILKKIYIDIYH